MRVSLYPVKSSPRISTFASRSLSIQRTSVECETPRSRASFSPETAIVMFCIRAKRSSSSLRSMGAPVFSVWCDSQVNVRRRRRVRQRTHGNNVDAGLGIITNGLERDSTRGLQRNSSTASTHGIPRLFHREVIEKNYIGAGLYRFFDAFGPRYFHLDLHAGTGVIPGRSH